MKMQLVQADAQKNEAQIRFLLSGYLEYVLEMVQEAFEYSFDVEEFITIELEKIGQFMPPSGRLLLLYEGKRPVGMGGLRQLDPKIGEIKRMYVRQDAQRNGFGQQILTGLLQEAQTLGYEKVRLDVGSYAQAARQLYRTTGFQEITPYEGNDIPPELHVHWHFMELLLK